MSEPYPGAPVRRQTNATDVSEVSVGELVGVTSPTQLATIVALDPIYVNFNVNEQDVLRVRAEARLASHPTSRFAPVLRLAPVVTSVVVVVLGLALTWRGVGSTGLV